MIHTLIHESFALQRSLYEGMAGVVRDYQSTPGAGLVLWLYGLSFAYGVLHAVGPGHGKIAISSYLMASGSKVRRGLWITLLSSLAQAVSAVAVVGVLALILRLTSRRINDEVSTFETVSYGLITLVGLWMLFQALRGGHHHHPHGDEHAEGREHPHDHEHAAHPPRQQKTTLAAVIIAVGIRPCSGAVLVLLFTLGQGIFGLGIGAAFIMSLGTATTVTALASFAVLARRSALRVIKIDSPVVAIAEKAFAIGGAVFIILGGGLFLLAALQPASSL